jgi:titin
MTISSTKKTFVTAISALLLSVLTLGSISPAQAALDGYTTSRAGTVVTVEVDCSLPYSTPGTFAYIEAYPGDTISFTSKLSGADECAYIYLSSGDMSIFDSAPVSGATTNAVFVSKSSVAVGTDSVWFPIYSASEKGQHFVIRFVEDPTPKAPGTPGTPLATAGNGQATIEISSPTTGGPADSYTVTASPSGATCTITVPETSCTITGLTNGYTYSFTSTATNAVGTSAPSASSNSVTPAALEAPGIPDAPTAQAGDASATVTVVAPSTGGPADSITVTANPGGATCVVTAPFSSCEITGLTNGTDYTFTATATNAAGTSEASVASSSVTPTAPLEAPGVPETPTVEAGDGAATITVSAPSTGGAVDSYTVTASPSGQTCTITTPDTACTISGLTNGYTYTFTVTATNAAGTSASSASSNSVTPAAIAVPGVPGTPTVEIADGSATVTVVAPSTGGAADSYTVTATPGGATCVVTVPDTSCEITGLTNGTPYTFTATATNASGSSEPSTASAAATPLAVPSAPGQPTRTLSGSSVNLSWSAPTSGTAPFTYTITASPAGPVCVVNGTTANCSGLVSGRAYTFTVTATNGAGSATSVATSSVTYTKPSTVTKKTLTGNKNFAGFAAGKSVLTLAMKKSIQSFVAANRSSSTFVCVGYVSSAPKMSTDKALAQARAKAACDYIVKLKPSAKVSREGVVPKNATGANSRKVVLKAYKLTSN